MTTIIVIPLGDATVSASIQTSSIKSLGDSLVVSVRKDWETRTSLVFAGTVSEFRALLEAMRKAIEEKAGDGKEAA